MLSALLNTSLLTLLLVCGVAFVVSSVGMALAALLEYFERKIFYGRIKFGNPTAHKLLQGRVNFFSKCDQ
jgi:hypothetical protein